MSAASEPGGFVRWRTTHGTLRGIRSGGVAWYLGVPYGGDTGGRNRFGPPPPLEPWSGERDATRFGPAAPQLDTRIGARANTPAVLSLLYPRGGSPLEGGPYGEDCLRLDVWAPADAEPGSLPVVVWLHGGAFVHGSGNEQVFQADRLVAQERIVVVTVTHRLGALGFLDLRDLGEPQSPNAGMLDIVQALAWVRANIAAVGGDPHEITVAGQSGGCIKTAALLAMPAAAPLFRRAMLMSFPVGRMADPDVARALRERVFAEAGVRTVDEARALPLERLLEAQRRAGGAPEAAFGDGWSAEAPLPGFGPSIEPSSLPEHPFWPAPAAGVAGKDLVFGWTSHEFGLFAADDPWYRTDLTVGEVAERVGDAAVRELAERHPGEPPHLLWARARTDRIFRDPILELAGRAAGAARSVWVYEFGYRTEVLDGLLGACHSIDLAFLFGTVDRIPLSGQAASRFAVAHSFMRSLGSFARSGRPGPGWTDWTSGRRAVLRIAA